MTEIKSIENFNQQINQIQQELNNKINEIKTQINNYNNNSQFDINLTHHVGESDEKYLEKGEGIVDQTITSIQLNNLILEKENEMKATIEKTNKKLNELFSICKANKTILIIKNNENINKII